jgi:hypothetical protein
LNVRLTSSEHKLFPSEEKCRYITAAGCALKRANSARPVDAWETFKREFADGKAGYSDFEASGEEWRAYTRLAGARTIEVAQRVAVRNEFAANSAMRAVLPIAALIPLSWLLVGWVVARFEYGEMEELAPVRVIQLG